MQESLLESQVKPFFKKPNRDVDKLPGKQYPNPQPGIMGPIPEAVDPAKSRWDEKLQALRTQRPAQGLCMTCGEKWNRNHTCPKKVALHVLEELMAAVQPDSFSEQSSDKSSDDEGDEIFSLSYHANEGVQGKKTIKLSGLVNHQELLILIDSGSSCPFISDKAVKAYSVLWFLLLFQLLQ